MNSPAAEKTPATAPVAISTSQQPYYSLSRQMADRFSDGVRLRRLVAFTYIGLTGTYLAWRLTTINPNSVLLSSAYYLAECLGFLLGLVLIFSSWTYRHRDPPPAPPGLTVDVFVLTYKEPLSVIKRTLIGAVGISYPHRTVVLDDGNRADIQRLAESLGITYLSRGENRHAKAGNLNFGLTNSQADFIACFDADHIAQPHALNAMLGFFGDPDVAMVQTPQDYFNTDAFQYMNPRNKPGLWHDQSFFYNVAQPCRDAWNGASCVGTGVVYRTYALRAIGGVPTETVTEDIHTSLRLHKRGYKTVYLNEPVAFGIAAADLGEYYKTRRRWAHGNLDALSRENVLTGTGLTLPQRLSYLSLGLIYLEGWQQLVLIWVPILALAFGIAPFEITLFNVLVVFCFPVLSMALLQELGCGFSRIWTNEVYAMARWPIHIVSTAGLFRRKLVWRSSSKNIQGRISVSLMTPQIAVLLLSLAAVVYALWRLARDFQVGPIALTVRDLFTGPLDISEVDFFTPMVSGYSIDLVAIASFWALFNAARALWFINKVTSNARHSHEPQRFRIPFPVLMPGETNAYACVDQISETWLRVRSANTTRYRKGDQIPIQLLLPAGTIHCRVQIGEVSSAGYQGTYKLLHEADEHLLLGALYSVHWHREFQVGYAEFFTFSRLFRGIRRGFTPVLQLHAKDWEILVFPATGTSSLSTPALLGGRRTGKPQPLISFAPLQKGQTYRALDARGNQPGTVDITILETLPICALPHRNMDGTRYEKYLVRVHSGASHNAAC